MTSLRNIAIVTGITGAGLGAFWYLTRETVEVIDVKNIVMDDYKNTNILYDYDMLQRDVLQPSIDPRNPPAMSDDLIVKDRLLDVYDLVPGYKPPAFNPKDPEFMNLIARSFLVNTEGEWLYRGNVDFGPIKMRGTDKPVKSLADFESLYNKDKYAIAHEDYRNLPHMGNTSGNIFNAVDLSAYRVE